ncbi:hypothetical protein ACEPPN_004174 [Leptodophora sp. 'Broadleaf-Isolate-01']
MRHGREPKSTVHKLIKGSLNCSLQVSFPRRKSSQGPRTTLGFVFDIDGVLYSKWGCLRRASRTLKYLQEMKIPFVFLTNRWQETASEGASWVRKTFDLTAIAPIQYISGPSPFARLAPRFADELVLLVGLNTERTKYMAKILGFNNVITPVPKLLLWIRPTEPNKPEQDKQLIVDLLLSEHGVVGTVSGKNGEPGFPNWGYQQDEQPGIWFGVALPFRETLLQHFWEKTSCAITNITTFGKPAPENFRMAEIQLLQWHHHIHGADAPKIDTVWMIGDNINDDILGANRYNFDETFSICSWKTILVDTGLYHPGMLNGRSEMYWPSIFSTGVWDAVQLALREKYEQHWWQTGGGNRDQGNSGN